MFWHNPSESLLGSRECVHEQEKELPDRKLCNCGGNNPYWGLPVCQVPASAEDVPPISFRAPQKGPENWCRAKSVEKCRKLFDAFCPARKMSKSVTYIFDTFRQFLTFVDVAPFRWPLLRSPLIVGDVKHTHTPKSWGCGQTHIEKSWGCGVEVVRLCTLS